MSILAGFHSTQWNKRSEQWNKRSEPYFLLQVKLKETEICYKKNKMFLDQPLTFLLHI